MSPSLPSQVNIYRTVILPVVLCWRKDWYLTFREKHGLAEDLLASQEGLGSMELIQLFSQSVKLVQSVSQSVSQLDTSVSSVSHLFQLVQLVSQVVQLDRLVNQLVPLVQLLSQLGSSVSS